MNAIAQEMQVNRALSEAMNATEQQDEKPQRTSGMTIDVQTHDCLAHIIMSGSFNFQTWRSFTNCYTSLLDNPALSEIRLDMTGVNYLDSSALGMLLLLNERAQENNIRVVLHITSNFVLRAFEYARLSRLISVECSD